LGRKQVVDTRKGTRRKDKNTTAEVHSVDDIVVYKMVAASQRVGVEVRLSKSRQQFDRFRRPRKPLKVEICLRLQHMYVTHQMVQLDPLGKLQDMSGCFMYIFESAVS